VVEPKAADLNGFAPVDLDVRDGAKVEVVALLRRASEIHPLDHSRARRTFGAGTVTAKVSVMIRVVVVGLTSTTRAPEPVLLGADAEDVTVGDEVDESPDDTEAELVDESPDDTEAELVDEADSVDETEPADELNKTDEVADAAESDADADCDALPR
jgi:hypothetical protein